MSVPFVILSAGGTGGHMTPALALGRNLMSRGARVEIITDVRGKKFESMFNGIPMHVVPAGTFGAGAVGKVKGLSGLALGVLRAVKILRTLKPDLVVGFGGYPSVPGVYAAQRLKIPTMLHEQNATLGKANVFLAKNAARIALSWKNTKGIKDSIQNKCTVTGNPVREEIAALHSLPYPAITPNSPLRIFIMGGSLGAKVFSTVVPQALSALLVQDRVRLEVVQQCRAEQLEDVRRAYAAAGIKAELASFFNNVPEHLTKAHLVIARSGASTVAEVTAAGRPAIYVPYPHHKDQQQKVNADAVSGGGGAWTMLEDSFTPDALLARIQALLHNPPTLAEAAEKARHCGKPDAAQLLGDLVSQTIGN